VSVPMTLSELEGLDARGQISISLITLVPFDIERSNYQIWQVTRVECQISRASATPSLRGEAQHSNFGGSFLFTPRPHLRGWSHSSPEIMESSFCAYIFDAERPRRQGNTTY